MNFEYKDYELSNAITDIAAGPFGSNLKVPCFTQTGFPIIDGANLKEITVTDNITKFVPEDKARALHRSIAKRRDVVVTISGNVGQVSYIPDNSQYAEYLCSQRQFRVTFDESKIYVPYLVYYLHSVEGQSKILAFANQTGVPALSQPLKNFRKIKIDLPSLAEQKKIATILSALDEKIAINRAINENLERQAQALYKAWFVDFSVFGGTVPNDWQTYHLADFLPVITGKKNANVSSSQGKYPFFSCSQDYAWTNEYSFDGSAILVAGNGDFNVKFYSGQFEAYQRTYVLIPNEPKYTAWLFYAVQYHLSSITSAARGSVIKFITKGNLEDFKFVAPKDPLTLPVVHTLDTINKQIAANREENIKLGALRDTLLPKLMSGELDVSDLDF